MKEKKTILSGLAGLISGSATVIFSSCAASCAGGGAVLCGVPLLSVFGVSTAAVGQFRWLTYILIPVSLLFFGLAFYRLYKKKPVPKCEDDQATCACPPHTNKRIKRILWASFIVSLSLISFTMARNNDRQAAQNCTAASSCTGKETCTPGGNTTPTLTAGMQSALDTSKLLKTKGKSKSSPNASAPGCKKECSKPCDQKADSSATRGDCKSIKTCATPCSNQ